MDKGAAAVPSSGIKRRNSSKRGISPSPSSPARNATVKYKPCHQVRESLFSSSSGFVNYRGMLNNCILCLVLSNSRYVLYNLNKYGVLVDPHLWLEGLLQFASYPVMILVLMLVLYPTLALWSERMAAKKHLSDRTVLLIYTILIGSLLIMPAVTVLMFKPGAVGSFVILFTYTIAWMKLLSYCQINHWCRVRCQQVPDSDDGSDKVLYPDNLTVKDLTYFLLAPTLCYELNFPRTPGIRKKFLLRRTIESVFLMNILIALTQQWLVPTVVNAVEPFQRMDFTLMCERILMLALPNHVLWLLMFYWFFHSYLNLWAELLCFGDRCFYLDWWNAQTIAEFWRGWNIPVHKWAIRHVYGPILKMGCSKLVAQMVVFLLSAFFHEYLISIPLQMLRPWAFTAMLAQIPLAVLTSLDSFRGQIGNVIVWVSIILGQPLAILMYMHDHYLLNYLLNQATNDFEKLFNF